MDYKVSDTDLTGIADKIRAKGSTSALMEFPTGFANAIDAIPTGITPTGTKNISTNGTHDVTNYASANVAVPASAVDSGTKNINSNGTHDVVGYASAAVSVPNSYSQSDEGKVVSNGALVSQSSQTIDTNGTYDTTLKNEVVVDVQGGGGGTYEVDEVQEYTLTEDWTSDTNGNTLNFVNTFMNATQNDERFRIAYVYENTWTGSYKASVFWLFMSGASTNSGSGSFANTYPTRTLNSSASFWMKAGSKIRVIFLKDIKRDSSEVAPS